MPTQVQRVDEMKLRQLAHSQVRVVSQGDAWSPSFPLPRLSIACAPLQTEMSDHPRNMDSWLSPQPLDGSSELT